MPVRAGGGCEAIRWSGVVTLVADGSALTPGSATLCPSNHPQLVLTHRTVGMQSCTYGTSEEDEDKYD